MSFVIPAWFYIRYSCLILLHSQEITIGIFFEWDVEPGICRRCVAYDSTKLQRLNEDAFMGKESFQGALSVPSTTPEDDYKSEKIRLIYKSKAYDDNNNDLWIREVEVQELWRT